jgi:hypothetical protein
MKFAREHRRFGGGAALTAKNPNATVARIYVDIRKKPFP